ncbi:MAG: aldehyde dehydrogenase family protein [Armatimonadota bacterium]|nr:aldehyde dehydrogenase family protein [Armatimonadota bacterium]
MKMIIGGEWVETNESIEVINPFDGSVIDTVPSADASNVESALQRAVVGAKEMSKLSARERSEILARAADLLQDRLDEFAVTIAKEVGKTIKEARTEVTRACLTIRTASEEAKRIHGETVPFDGMAGAESKFGFYIRVPVGVVLAITPFNVPLNLACHKVAPAIAAGNAVILKPATATPLADIMLGKLLLDAGLPPNAISVITGRGPSIGNLLVSDSRVRLISFTGSPEVGEAITRIAGLKKIAMELGSNSCAIVMDDADLDEAARRVRIGGYAVAGQVCISVQRVIVQEKVYDVFLEKLVPLVAGIRVGNQLDSETDMGPMIDEKAALRVESWIEEAIAGGAKSLLPIKRDGAILFPTVLTDVTLDMKVWSEEVFGPLVAVVKCRDFDHAIELANTSKYGLQAGIFTRNLEFALRAAREIEVGGVIINDVPTFRIDPMPYGGVKLSGFGREGPKYAIEEMTELKLVAFQM